MHLSSFLQLNAHLISLFGILSVETFNQLLSTVRIHQHSVLDGGSTFGLPEDLSQCLEGFHVIFSEGWVATHHKFEFVRELRVPSWPKQELEAFPLKWC